ncbi:hypothetical protein [Croceibacterium ferulae]|uniref:hypothetical protein n=1 Tax=Croceibacterium ferulae TaxID=1854641 RepID=UPI000EB45DF1|nr:hypothetical protein [Croceibacterium ferulae]
MTSRIYFDPNPLPVHFQSVIVKRSAVARSYPDGVQAFIERYRPNCPEGQLFSLTCMSWEDVEYILAGWNGLGIIAGEDVAVCDMHLGPLLHCNGIRLEFDGAEEFFGTWFTFYDPAYVAPQVPKKQFGPPEPPVVAEEPTAPFVPPEVPEGTPWRRVTFGSGAIHWIGGDEDYE